MRVTLRAEVECFGWAGAGACASGRSRASMLTIKVVPDSAALSSVDNHT